MENKKIIVFTLSEDIQKALIKELMINYFEVTCCHTAEHCIEEFKWGKATALFVEVDPAQNDAFLLCEQIKQLNPTFPIIILVSKDDIASTVRAIKMKLQLVYEKPLDRKQLAPIIKFIREKNRSNERNTEPLMTDGDRKILRYIFAGKTNRQISKLIKKSVRTVEEHRADIMHKLGVDNPVDLVDRAISLDLLDKAAGYSLDGRAKNL